MGIGYGGRTTWFEQVAVSANSSKDGLRLSLFSRARFSAAVWVLFLLQALQEVIPHTQRVGHDGERRIDRAARREEGAVDDIERIARTKHQVDVRPHYQTLPVHPRRSLKILG